jgi:YesN/AraC family two-component response regulator
MNHMDHEYELKLFSEFLKKCNVRVTMMSVNDSMDVTLDPLINNVVGVYSDSGVTLKNTVGIIENTTKYKFTNELKLQYVFMRLPILSEKNILFIGPYLSEPLKSNELLEIGERLKLPPIAQKLFGEYYSTLPVFTENDSLFIMIDTFCERMWQTTSFSIIELNEKNTLPIFQIDNASRGNTFDETFANMEMMEMRYAFENELIQAVALGQQHKEKMLVSAFNEQMFEKRLQDTLRNAKNYCIIMNTLLRKAAEQGGVHPIYIDKISSRFATRIEFTSNVKAIPELMREMFSSYCRLVRKHSTKKYSPIVQKAIVMIDSDISAELSLRILAQNQNISEGYLATVFKRETGKTVSEYIRDRRIDRAVHLLSTTSLQIQTIAMHCGIMDVQYFSKIFKRQIGMTPKEYRETVRR